LRSGRREPRRKEDGIANVFCAVSLACWASRGILGNPREDLDI
jgi:hypothetical protein